MASLICELISQGTKNCACNQWCKVLSYALSDTGHIKVLTIN